MRLQMVADDAGRFHNFICGVMPVMQQPFFERMLFRISRGNAYARYECTVSHSRPSAVALSVRACVGIPTWRTSFTIRKRARR